MSIIVPSMARDQYGYLAQPDTAYDEPPQQDRRLRARLHVSARRLERRVRRISSSSPLGADVPPPGANYLYTNLPYTLRGGGDRPRCRRPSSAAGGIGTPTCHLMQATRPEARPSTSPSARATSCRCGSTPASPSTSVSPAHMVEFTYPISRQALRLRPDVLRPATCPTVVGVTHPRRGRRSTRASRSARPPGPAA